GPQPDRHAPGGAGHLAPAAGRGPGRALPDGGLPGAGRVQPLAAPRPADRRLLRGPGRGRLLARGVPPARQLTSCGSGVLTRPPLAGPLRSMALEALATLGHPPRLVG